MARRDKNRDAVVDFDMHSFMLDERNDFKIKRGKKQKLRSRNERESRLERRDSNWN